MNQHTEKPMTFGDFENGSYMPPVNGPVNGVEELDWLMSLALDDALDEGEAARLEHLLAQEPAL